MHVLLNLDLRYSFSYVCRTISMYGETGLGAISSARRKSAVSSLLQVSLLVCCILSSAVELNPDSEPDPIFVK
jgi:hypothetical protein